MFGLCEVQSWKFPNRNALPRETGLIDKHFSSHQYSIIADLFALDRNNNIPRHQIMILNKDPLALSYRHNISFPLRYLLDLQIAAIQQQIIDAGRQD